jgi:hypothetical protein
MISLRPLIQRPISVGIAVLALWIGSEPGSAVADNVVEVPVLAAIQVNDRGVFQVLVLNWDKQTTPDPLEVKWGNNRIKLKGTGLGALDSAFHYALERTSSTRHTGTLSIYGAAYAPATSDGPSAGAAMAVGFIAVLRGDGIIRGVAMTGTLEPGGRIGPVGAIPDKIRAAVREGYKTILIPEGQFHDPRWNLNSLALELNITVKEVSTIDEAYELMTGRRL